MVGKEILCFHCGKKFKKVSYNQKYCSRNCYNEKIKEDLEEKEAAHYIIFNRDDYRCCYCGKSSIEDNVRLLIEHVIPRNLGGDDSIYNVVTSCEECNRMKGPRVLRFDVYKRILLRNIRRNSGISIKRRNLVRQFLANKYGKKDASILPLIKMVYWEYI